MEGRIYHSLNPEFALFANQAGQTTPDLEVTVDANGKANAVLQKIVPQNGAAIVGMEVIRPQQDRMREITLAKGQTIVTWSAPSLALDVGGPQTGVPGQRMTIGASLRNDGDLIAENCALQVQLPAGLRIVSATPQPASGYTEQTAIWEQGPIPPGQQLTVSIEVEAANDNDFNILFTGSSNNAPQVTKPHRVLVSQPRIVIDALPENFKTDIDVGQDIAYNIQLRNNGNVAINNLSLRIEADPGLVEASQKLSTVDQRVGNLGVSQVKDVRVTFSVRKEGPLNAIIKAYSGGALLGSQTISLRGITPAARVPRVSLTIEPDGPPSIPLGGTRTVRFLVANSGDTPLNNLQLSILWDPSLLPVNATESLKYVAEQNRLLWSATQPLQPSGSQAGEFRVEFRAADGVQQGSGRIAAEVTTGQQVSDQKQVTLTIGDTAPAGPGAGGGVVPGGGAGGGAGGGVLPGTSNFGSLRTEGAWGLDIQRESETIKAGEPAKFIVRMKNGQNTPDSKHSIERRSDFGGSEPAELPVARHQSPQSFKEGEYD